MHNYVNIVLALFDDTVVLACLYYRKDRNSLTDSIYQYSINVYLLLNLLEWTGNTHHPPVKN